MCQGFNSGQWHLHAHGALCYICHVCMHMYIRTCTQKYVLSYCSQNVNVKFPNDVNGYRLTGVVTYVRTGNASHYMAFVQSIKDINQWFAANDSQVKNLHAHVCVITTKNALIFLENFRVLLERYIHVHSLCNDNFRCTTYMYMHKCIVHG